MVPPLPFGFSTDYVLIGRIRPEASHRTQALKLTILQLQYAKPRKQGNQIFGENYLSREYTHRRSPADLFQMKIIAPRAGFR